MTDMRTGSETSLDERFKLLVTSISDYAIYLVDTEGVVVSWNAGAQRFKGYLANEIIGQNFSKFFTPEDIAAGTPARSLATALREGRCESEGWRVRKDGSRFWASVVVDAVPNAAGEVIGFAKITRDITDQKLAQDALRQSEEQLRLLIQGVTDYAIYMLSPTGVVTNWNSGAQRIKQYRHDEIVGKNFALFYTDAEREAGAPARTLSIATERGRFETEGLRVRKDGSQFWAHVIVDAIFDEKGELIGFAKVTRDITERRQAAKALDDTKNALAQSQKMEAIGQLTAGISHDFNNLLAVIANSLDILSIKGLVPEGSHLVDSMRRAVDRGSRLTQQLLAFARQQPLNPELIDVNEVIVAFEEVLKRAGTVNLKFEFALDAHLHKVLVDGPRLESAILNLVVNARDAMPEGGLVTIATKNVVLAQGEVGRLASGEYVLLEVRDTGQGMSPDDLARAFDPFFTTKAVGKGTGLGLSQVYGFISQSEGEVVIQSEPGQGTTVRIYLARHADGNSEAVSDGLPPETILVAEDEPDLLEVVAELFENLGYRVLKASSGKDALAILENESNVSLLFSDVMMPPGMSGVELARRSREQHPEIKILLASGYPIQILRTQHPGMGEFSFVAKPYLLSELTAKVHELGAASRVH